MPGVKIVEYDTYDVYAPDGTLVCSFEEKRDALDLRNILSRGHILGKGKHYIAVKHHVRLSEAAEEEVRPWQQ